MICQDYLRKTMPQIICNAALTNKTNANKFDVPSSAVLCVIVNIAMHAMYCNFSFSYSDCGK